MKKPSYVLDSFAVLAYFQAEPGGVKVKSLLKKASAENVPAFLSLINLGEIIYITERKMGRDIAENTLEDILRLPIQIADRRHSSLPSSLPPLSPWWWAALHVYEGSRGKTGID